MNLDSKWIPGFLFALTMTISYLRPSPFMAQTTMDYEIVMDKENYKISPYIYGTNDWRFSAANALRHGGNRTTGYNWENNASNAGEDYFNNSDDYLAWMFGIPSELYDSTAIVWTHFQDIANKNGQYSLLTLPMAGYVAADKDGTVPENETAPSARWNKIEHRKGSALSTRPDLNDGTIYTDEAIHFMMNHYGDALSPTGVNAYEMDNEPGLWQSTHPRIHLEKTRVEELLSRSEALASTIKLMDPVAEVFGPALYGFNAYLSLQDAPDWKRDYESVYEWFISAYLDYMSKASAKAGHRLLDVLDLHWYPEPPGVYAGDTSRTASENRMQCVRSLWDSTYVEDSWIGKWFSPVAIIPHLKHSIKRYFPGTKLAITEYNYSGSNHISGGIAQIEALGTFGNEGVYLATNWYDVNRFIRAGFLMFLDYDGSGHSFGDVHVRASTQDVSKSSIFAAYESEHPARLHVILTNKSYDEDIKAKLHLRSPVPFYAVQRFALYHNDTNIVALPEERILSNLYEMVIPRLSAVHLVFYPSTNSLYPTLIERRIHLYPNPAKNQLHIFSEEEEIGDVRIFDMSGRPVFQKTIHKHAASLMSTNWPSGIYMAKIRLKHGVITRKFAIVQ